ncbi:hypothetical protein AQUCO_00700094v1 [Aquilegia coerulea]|uniref:Proteasome assembly chaperone 2 n=1 Tax=Aquilegia coerulea TaxID=218851 RepID=A0A2G5EIG8_AQUCA|nr:hypothetical protein AQUCO_00700094v1 [Aquilegia coerulea]
MILHGPILYGANFLKRETHSPLQLPSSAFSNIAISELFSAIRKKKKKCSLLSLSMEFVLDKDQHIHDECSTLILPALSIGNVGQLAIDLLVSSSRAERIGYLDDSSVLPCVGNDAYAPVPQGVLALPLEAYESLSNALTLVQQRSPIVKGMMIEFAKNLADFAATNGKKHVVVLSSLDSGRRQKIDMSSPDGTDDHCEKLGWKVLQEYNIDQRRWKLLSSLAEGNSSEDASLFEDELLDEDYYPSLPFAAFFSCCKAKGLKVTCVLSYCSEGDNIADSLQMADAVCKLLGLNPKKLSGNEGSGWLIPPSWKTVYGPPSDMSLY